MDFMLIFESAELKLSRNLGNLLRESKKFIKERFGQV